MTARALHFIIPGDLASATGGYVYDRHLIEGLRALGWRVTIHGLDGSFPQPSAATLALAKGVFAGLPDRACVLIDGLALGALVDLIEAHRKRLTLIALMHALLGAETDISAAATDRLQRQERRALQSVEHVIVTGNSIRQALSERGLVRASVSLIEPGTAQASVARGGGETALALLCVATVSDGKGQELLLEALAPLAGLSWHLTCVGSLTRSPATARRVRERLQRLRLAERVKLVGEVSHDALSEFYHAADLFVLATQRESYCMAVAEALAHGLPVISTLTGAIGELMGADAGLLVPPGDVDGLRAALERVLTQPELLQSLRRGALAARARLTPWSRACARMSRLLTRICRQTQQPVAAL
jgi:glycosyltransferase involved in cell wall biosynthesis